MKIDEQRFNSLVAFGDPADCWLWAGTTHNGYGNISIAGRNWRAHRIAYELWVGPIPEGLHVLHTCGNSVCVNPTHLRPGDDSRNGFDSVRHGSHPWARKTHCPYGHPYAGENLMLSGTRNERRCRECQRAKSKRRWAKHVAARRAGETK